MTRRGFPGLFILAALSCLMAGGLCAQSRMLACESRGAPCTQMNIVWSFNGTQGTATPGGTLSIERFDAESLVVRRADSSGLTAVYTGAVHGTRIEGTVEWTWPGHDGYPASGKFAAILQDAPGATPSAPTAATDGTNALPEELLVCENNGPCNAAWILHGNEGMGTWFARNPVHAKLTVVRAEPDNLLIRRTDTTDGVTASYAGSLRGDHYSGVIVLDGTNQPGATTGTWTATIPQTKCAGDMDAPSALATGQTALMFKRNQDALNCYTVAANDGDARAQTAVGLLYDQGSGGVEQDYRQAFYWLHKAADQGVYPAQRRIAEMYAAGLGTPRDATMAHIYTARADEQKHDYERQQDLNEREADRRAQVLSSFVLGASFGLFF
ncbi:MAG TPA: tetratricopeptide repeat protein [Acidobacteriaceae bacterium]|nr:tetratricopeptide repeat protein [Acidobacteriaceae bacterium]